VELNDLITDFSASLFEGQGSFFVGAGISVPSGPSGWLKLLQPFAKKIGLEITENDNLPYIAQYIVNEMGGNRGPLILSMKNHFTKRYQLNDYHRALSKTNIRTIWTTNYDNLLERTFGQFIVDVKSSDDSISRSVSNHQIEIIKIHGCLDTSDFADIVIAQEDYDNFFERRKATTERLRTDLLNKSFLFIGYTYQDPNIRNIVVEARRLSKYATRQHYLILKKETHTDKAARQKLWVDDLKRFGISCALIDDFPKLKLALNEISRKSRGPTVYVTGSHEQKNSSLTIQIGKKLADNQTIIMLDGQSTGVSRDVLNAFSEECINKQIDIEKRLKLFPNPYAANPNFSNNINLIPILKEWRSPLLRSAQVILAFDGGIGTRAEIEVAKELGCKIIPVPKSSKGLALDLIKDPDIERELQQTCPTYLVSAQQNKITANGVIECVERMLN
jgi:hypothetical protein